MTDKAVRMEDSMTSSFASICPDRECLHDVQINPLAKEEFFIDEDVKILFHFPDEDRCPSYLDVVRVLPLDDASLPGEQLPSKNTLTFSYCHWKVESAAAHFSVTAKVETIVKQNEAIPAEGLVYIAQYFSSFNAKALAESHPFRVYPVTEESMIDLPGVFSPSDDGLIILGSGSDTEEAEIVERENPAQSLASSPLEGDDLAIVMSVTELRKMEDESKASSDKLRSFIEKYKGDLMELTKCNETLKQKLASEQAKVDTMVGERKKLMEDSNELKRVMSHQQTLFQKALTERERQLREEQKKGAKMTEENSVISGHLENLKCCVDAHLETKNILLAEIERLKDDKQKLLADIEKLQNVPKMEKQVDTLDLTQSPAKSAGGDLEDKVQDLILRLQSAKIEYISLYKENKRKEKALENICNWAALAKNGMSLDPPVPAASNTVPSLGSLASQKSSSYGLLSTQPSGRMDSAASSTKTPLSSTKALAPNTSGGSPPSSVTVATSTPDSGEKGGPFHFGLDSGSGLTSTPAMPPSATRSQPSLNSSMNPFASSEQTNDELEEDLIELNSEGKLCSLPPRQKRKIELVRRTGSAAGAAAGKGSIKSIGVDRPYIPLILRSASGAVVRALGRRQLGVLRGRHRSGEGLRNLQVKRDVTTALENDPANLPPAAPPAVIKTPTPIRPKACTKRKQESLLGACATAPKPSAPEEPFVAVGEGVATAQPTPRGMNTYSAALISDLETDASNTEEETSVVNPNICPLCVTSILDYEAHMREAHQKQPCPICGYVFDTNIPLYVMTYHIERHLEETPDGTPARSTFRERP